MIQPTPDPDRLGPVPAHAPGPGVAGAGRSILHDYNRAAAAYWWLLVLAGGAVLGLALTRLAGLPADAVAQVLGASLIACVVGLFPLRVPRTKTSFAAGDIFIFLLLLVHGPWAAVVAASAEAAACAWRTSDRWSSRIVGPASAAVAMLACGQAYSWAVGRLAAAGVAGDGVVFAAALAFAALYFLLSPTLVTSVIYLKRRRAPTLSEWFSTFGWLGMGYAASASIAGVLFLAFRQFGLTTVLVAVPMIGMFVASMRVYFAHQEAAEREAAERASRERADNAEREAAMAALHLKALELSDRRFESAFADAAIGMALVSGDGRLLQVNPALGQLLGRDVAALRGQRFIDIIDPGDLPALERQLQRLQAGQASGVECELRCRHALGHEVWASLHASHFARGAQDEPTLIVQAFDVSARRRAEARLQHLAYHDVLTDLANRSRLRDSVSQAIGEQAQDPAQRFSVLHLSFDRYKQLNDSLGRGVGDQFLVVVARRLQTLLRPADLLARLDGDDFGVLLRHRGGGSRQAVALADRVRQSFAAPVRVGDCEIHTGASIGITGGDLDYARADDVLRDAGLAMSRARAEGRSRHALFDPSLHERARDLLQLETDLRQAIADGRLELAFQPIHAIGVPQRRVGFEALARWTHPSRGPVSPAEFIPVAEDSGLIVALTRWALQAACAQLGQWRGRLPASDELFVNVNIAGQDLAEPDFADFVRDTLARHGLPERCLTLEITETALMQQLALGRRTLARLREMGIGLSVDDFGTGYSSLSHLSTLPINSLKIDRSFVARLDGGSVEGEIVRAVIQLGQALGKRVVAEGIETDAQLDRLRELGCGYAQGFLLGRPARAAHWDGQLALPSRSSPDPDPQASSTAQAPVPAAARPASESQPWPV
jgi:diguanylate cyclase (GGDEF)-like protein/PAS domain S-box-containing protein